MIFSGSGKFRAPTEVGAFEVSSAFTPSSSFELTVYDPEAITLEIEPNPIAPGYPRSFVLRADTVSPLSPDAAFDGDIEPG